MSLKITTDYGIFEGVLEDEYIIFKGIPYAKAPIGNLRFSKPQKLDKNNKHFMADRFGNRSAQLVHEDKFYKKEFYEDSIFKTLVSEDSLFLNIWIPKNANIESNLPVAVYIHGGGFLGGTAHELELRTGAYATKDVILITLNYRVGIFGFLAHPWLTQEDSLSCGNYGILDQIMALEWVKENIKLFCGDPNNITIFGQSAGAISVRALISSEFAKNKFSRAIIQSGGGYPTFLIKEIPLDKAYKVGEQIFELLNVSSLEQLREISTEKILNVQKKFLEFYMRNEKGFPFGPVINKKFIKDTFDNLLEKGEVNKVPIIIGTTRHDIGVSVEESKKFDSKFQQSSIKFSLMNEKISDLPTYVYYFQRSLPGDDSGAFHSSELWYMFGTLNKCWRPMTNEDYKLSNLMIDYWTNFMKNGNPNSDNLINWSKCSENNKFVMKFDI